MPRKPFDSFDEFAQSYRRIHNEGLRITGGESDHFSEQKIEEVRRNERGSTPTILDLGCGDGNSASYFQKYFCGCDYHGLDTSRDSILIAKDRDLKAATFSHYDGLKIPYPEGNFDIVFIACVLHHVDSAEHENTLNEVRRVLKPGGRLYIFEHNPFNPVTRRIVNNCPFDEDAVLLKSSYTRKMLKGLNFQDVEVAYTIFFPRHKIFRAILGLEKYLKWLPLGGQYYARSVKS